MIFCRDARRSKALFETEAKASGFIKYNRYAIKRQTGIAPIRAYHCTSCGGWHVTSRKVVFDLPDKAEVMIAAYQREYGLDGKKEEKNNSLSRAEYLHKKQEQRREERLKERERIREQEQEVVNLLKARIGNDGPLMVIYKDIEEIQAFLKNKTDKTRIYKHITKTYEKLGKVIYTKKSTPLIAILKNKLDSLLTYCQNHQF